MAYYLWFIVIAIGPLLMALALWYVFLRRRPLTPQETQARRETVEALYTEEEREQERARDAIRKEEPPAER